MVHRFGEANDDPYGQGLGRVLFWPAFFKRQSLGFWTVFADKFGSPSIKGKVPQGALDDQIDSFLADLKGLAQEGVIVVPDGWDVNLVEATRSGTITYGDLCRYMDEEIAVAILGNTLTTTAGAPTPPRHRRRPRPRLMLPARRPTPPRRPPRLNPVRRRMLRTPPRLAAPTWAAAKSRMMAKFSSRS